MNFNGSRSTSSCNANDGRNYEPFMLGTSHYGVNVPSSASASGFRSNGRSSVRDCMHWEDRAAGMGNAANIGNGGGGCWSQGGSGGMGMMGGNMGSMNPTTTSMGFNYAQPKAFVTSGGNGQGEGGSRSSIPCKLAPIGTNPQSLLQPLDPVTLRVMAPAPSRNANGGQAPYTFTIDPSQIYGQPQKQ